MTGKEKCEILKQLRRSIAEANGIVYLAAECSHTSDCSGHCEKCEAEARYLDAELNRLAQKGKELKITNLAYQSFLDSALLSEEKHDATTDNVEYMVEDKSKSFEKLTLSTPIEELKLPVKVYNPLRRAEIDTVGDLVNMSYSDLRNIRNLGRYGINEIIQRLHSVDLGLREGKNRNEMVVETSESLMERVLKMTVDELNMSDTTTHMLKTAGINTVGEMVEYTDWDFVLINRRGGESKINSMCEIEAKLYSLGLSLKENPIEKLTIDYVEET